MVNEKIAAIHYISFDRHPVQKGASIHIQAFINGLKKRYAPIYLTTLPGESSTITDLKPATKTRLHKDGENQRVFHFPIEVSGKNTIERVIDYRKKIFASWNPAKVFHFRSIFEGYPIAKWVEDKKRGGKESYGIVYEVNGLPSVELKYHYPHIADDKELLTKLRAQEDFCLKAADLIVTVSQVNAEHLIFRGADPDKIRIIPNGVDIENFSYRQPRSFQDQWRVLYVGTLSAWQGLKTALEAIALARKDFPKIHFTVIGEARDRQRKELLRLAEKLQIQDSFQVLPSCSQKELAIHYHHSHCVLAPLLANDRNTMQGCCPLKVLEALSCGTPVIASDLAVVRELCESGKEAILTKPGNPKSIKDGIVRLIADPGLCRRLSAAGRRTVKTKYTWTIAQDKLLHAYQEFFPNLLEKSS